LKHQHHLLFNTSINSSSDAFITIIFNMMNKVIATTFILLVARTSAFAPIAQIPQTIPTNAFKNIDCAKVIEERTNFQTSTSLQLSAAITAVSGAMTGGLFSGSLHAISGPDHLAALIPKCCGQRWYKAVRIGALWGMGHGISATLIGITAFGLKNRLRSSMTVGLKQVLARASHATELAVGISIVLIGIMGIREAKEWEEEIEGGVPQSLSSAAVEPGVKTTSARAVVMNGLLHGLSWDGAPSLAPALALATWSGNLTFLTAYSLGTTLAMAMATTIIGEGTRRAGEVFDRPDIPQKLSLGSSYLAIGIGFIWCALTLR